MLVYASPILRAAAHLLEVVLTQRHRLLGSSPRDRPPARVHGGGVCWPAGAPERYSAEGRQGMRMPPRGWCTLPLPSRRPLRTTIEEDVAVEQSTVERGTAGAGGGVRWGRNVFGPEWLYLAGLGWGGVRRNGMEWAVLG